MTTDLAKVGVLPQPRFVPALPARTQGDGRMAAARTHIAALRARHGTWAAIAELDSRHQAGNITHAVTHADAFGPSAHWEAAIRKHPDTGKFVVYVRFVGPEPRKAP